MKRGVRMLILGALAASAMVLAPTAARAEYCSSRIQIVSGVGVLAPVSTAPTGYLATQPDANRILCYDVGLYVGRQLDVGPGRSHDTRIITPGANMIMVRMFVLSQPPRLTLSGLINRRGIKMSLTRPPVPGTTLQGVYDSPWIPLDPTSKGSLTATVGGDKNTYHTVD